MITLRHFRRGRLSTAFATSLVLAAVGCGEIDVANPNNPSVDGLVQSPNATSASALATGLLRGTRANVAEGIRWLGAFGREGYPMSVTGASLPGSVRDPLNGNGFPGNVLYADPYRNIRSANLLLAAISDVGAWSDAQKEAARGFAKTIQAYDFLQVIVTRDVFGAPLDVGIDPTAPPAPIATKAQVYARIATLLDEARGHLQAGGTAFPFPLTSGFSGFNTPATFLRVNRALRARAAVYTDNWQVALTALSESFISTTAPLTLGAYHVFSTNSGDITNPNFRPDLLFAHPRLRTEAKLRADGSLDLRAQTKLVTVPTFTVQGISSNVQFTMYNSATASIPLIRNEELLLLRAEANLGLGNTALAIQDINLVRTTAGGLPPLPSNFSGDLLTELLYDKRYSLVWEGGHTWIDMRHYGRLAQIPVRAADPRLFPAMPIPVAECQPRTPQPTGCGIVDGITPPPQP
ncbi:RagB/SusD family nutrient uptake outer membrane protein [Gemmatimonas sp.]|jgi:hypothetical protein|uniref:RagB/SusD family nutrient uptake outer membrane protein n=1 Tax=Gemmatimonas sp. TaxID=1962908 RepID=UPI0025B89BDE|nr:RagB/SusD family nutrient uptake outer membrane protein [Gemmatimonas sp.]MCA2991360.1 RagB/SusD family nutrient uptake outer membrane protein [Gemmatimonas sp.]MCE2953781.1 RagB/SusD family nutrient uptake outer membrane protein [Gemmatimonas sp.]